MIIKIDAREKELFVECQRIMTTYHENPRNKTVISLVTVVLPLGDIVICDDDGAERIIIERKTLRDLAASIRDGRYSEQAYRMNECSIHNHNVYYLIEGDLDKYIPGRLKIDRSALVSANITLGFFKGFSTYKTKSVSESAEWLFQFADKLNKKGELGYFEKMEGEESGGPSYSEVIKRTKKECVTPSNIGEIMLAQIPNVSIACASHLIYGFGNLPNIIKALEKNEHALDGICITSKTGKIRRISKTSIANIYRFLINKPKEAENSI